MATSSAARLLRELREEQSRSLREAAQDLGVTPSYLSRVERGERGMNESFTARLAEYYGVPKDVVGLEEGRLPHDVLQILREHPELVNELRERFSQG